MTHETANNRGFAAMAVGLMLAVALVPALAISDDSEASEVKTATINIQRGWSYEWTPTFNLPVESVLVKAWPDKMRNDVSGFAQEYGYAKVVSGKVVIAIPSDYEGEKYYVKVKGLSSDPTQAAYYKITVAVGDYSFEYDQSDVTLKAGSQASFVPVFSGIDVGGQATASHFAVEGTLPEGMTLNATTGEISGTPTRTQASTDYTVTATLNTVPTQTIQTTVTIAVESNVENSAVSLYAISGITEVSVPGLTLPSGTSVSSLTVRYSYSNHAASVTSASPTFRGLTVGFPDGSITGVPSDKTVKNIVIKETFTLSNGAKHIRTVTMAIEPQVAITNSGEGLVLDSFVGHEDSLDLSKSGPGDVVWTVTSAGTGISIEGGKLVSSASTPAGTYNVTVTAKSASTATNTAGVTAAFPSFNTASKTFSVVVAPRIAIDQDGLDFYVNSDNTAYDKLTLSSNITGAAWAADYNGDVSERNVTVNASGVVKPGVSPMSIGAHTLTVTATDPANEDNFASATLRVHVSDVFGFTNEPVAGCTIGEARA